MSDKQVLRWEQLTDEQKKQVTEGDACGHPSNRPKTIDDATSRQWIVENGVVTGWGYGFKYTRE